ncbi:hypothetical protein DFP72DRAFT_1089695 [Ephemerocybe angulata]|uniref:Uncharacterized protein n=1 Tax=Ephemerocybe angulata TaxID=980116 RepID=A0A8H6I8T9_9AGAR|nr:hypothetical protein DFP72DRAFT_1089695 [Tulosesus angulatus]
MSEVYCDGTDNWMHGNNLGRDGPYDPNDQDDKTTTWPAPTGELDSLKETHRLNPVPFFDIDNAPMDPAGLLTHLVGAVVEVSFTLHHFAMKDSSGKATSDTFTARLVQLRVLRKAAAQPASPYHNSLRTGSPYIPPASPTRRHTHASAGPAVQQPEAAASTVPPTQVGVAPQPTAPVPDQADDSSDRSAAFSAPEPADAHDEDQADEAAGDVHGKQAREGDTVAGKAGKARRTGP